jgi:acetyl-CoA C-acetyltransferase
LKFAEGLIATNDAETVLCVHSEKSSLLSNPTQLQNWSSGGLNRQWEAHTGITFTTLAPLHATRYMHETGTTPEEMASVAVSCREWARLNPNALFRDSLTVDDVLGSPMIASPYHRYECNVLADGACAYVVAGDQTPTRLVDTPAYVLSNESMVTHASAATPPSVFVGGRDRWQDVSELALTAVEVDRESVDLVNIYGSSPAGHLELLEAMGFCDFGQAGEFVAAGETAPGGSLPMTTNGGTLSYGHLGNGFGMALIVETANQIMGNVVPDRQVPETSVAMQTGESGVGMDAKVALFGGGRP